MEVISAGDLMPRSKAGPYGQAAASNPFAKVLLLTAKGTIIPKQSARTAVCPGTLAPEWHEAFALGESLAETPMLLAAAVQCRVLHDDPAEDDEGGARKAKGKPLGSTEPLPLAALAEEPGMELEHWFPLEVCAPPARAHKAPLPASLFLQPRRGSSLSHSHLPHRLSPPQSP